MLTPIITAPDKERLFQVGVKRIKRFKAGAETGGPVALNVEVTETETEQEYTCQVIIRVKG